MTHAEVTRLMAENMQIMSRMSMRLQPMFGETNRASRQQMSVLVRLYLAGRIKLKDFANREVMSTANLCSAFRKLESEKLIMRSVDENDRRDMWYEVTRTGKNMAEKFLDKFMTSLESLFKVLPEKDEDKMADTIKTMNEILKKMEAAHA